MFCDSDFARLKPKAKQVISCRAVRPVCLGVGTRCQTPADGPCCRSSLHKITRVSLKTSPFSPLAMLIHERKCTILSYIVVNGNNSTQCPASIIDCIFVSGIWGTVAIILISCLGIPLSQSIELKVKCLDHD